MVGTQGAYRFVYLIGFEHIRLVTRCKRLNVQPTTKFYIGSHRVGLIYGIPAYHKPVMA